MKWHTQVISNSWNFIVSLVMDSLIHSVMSFQNIMLLSSYNTKKAGIYCDTDVHFSKKQSRQSVTESFTQQQQKSIITTLLVTLNYGHVTQYWITCFLCVLEAVSHSIKVLQTRTLITISCMLRLAGLLCPPINFFFGTFLSMSPCRSTSQLPVKTFVEVSQSVFPLLCVPKDRTEFGKRAFMYSAPSLWKSLQN